MSFIAEGASQNSALLGLDVSLSLVSHLSLTFLILAQQIFTSHLFHRMLSVWVYLICPHDSVRTAHLHQE